jgi:very-short-patch-repair endonuclease
MKDQRQSNKPTVEKARRLRRDMTIPERKLWTMLRGRQLARLKFRRQHPIGPYIADFACEEKKLVIELDGDSHIGRAAYDHRRQAAIEQLGYKVIRVGNDDVLRDDEAVLELILTACGIEPRAPHPHFNPLPHPLPKGEGTERIR